MTRKIKGSKWFATLAVALVIPCIADAAPTQAALTIRYPARGPGLTLSGEPEAVFRCVRLRDAVVCTVHVPRGATMALRARTRPPAGSASVSALSFPIDGKAWGGACAGTPADVCRLRVARALTVRIDTRDR